MIHLIIYNEREEVKAIPFENMYNKYFQAIPKENYFIKGLVIDGLYLTPYQVQKLLSKDLTPLENHFLTVRYFYHFELKGYHFRTENTPYVLTIDDIKILQHLKNTAVL